jgi:hypothetical protein
LVSIFLNTSSAVSNIRSGEGICRPSGGLAGGLPLGGSAANAEPARQNSIAPAKKHHNLDMTHSLLMRTLARGPAPTDAAQIA